MERLPDGYIQLTRASQPGIYVPVTEQPMPWISVPENVYTFPPSLEFLATRDQLLVRREFSLPEVTSSCETSNMYSILESGGERLYYAIEQSESLTRCCCGSCRSLVINIMDNNGRTVISLKRPLNCQSCCYPCCLQSMEVTSPPGTVIGTIEQQWTLCIPKLLLKNANGDPVLRIEAPCWAVRRCSGDYKLKSSGNIQVGQICMPYAVDLCCQDDVFSISFPMDLDVKMKAVVLGGCFLIDMMYSTYNKNMCEKLACRMYLRIFGLILCLVLTACGIFKYRELY